MLTEATARSINEKLNGKNVPESFDANFITENFFPYEWKHQFLSSINTGRCYDWAYIAYCLWPNVTLWTTERHAWVEVSGLFYDSESPSGVEDHQKLRCNETWGWDDQEPIAIKPEEFKDFWNENGGGRKYHWDDLHKEILELDFQPIRK